MNSSYFLSDNIDYNIRFDSHKEKTFLSDDSKNQINNKDKSFEIKNYHETINKNCVFKSATSKKWSIKFK